MKNKEDNFKEKFRQALISTAKVISDDYKLDIDSKKKNLSSKSFDFFELDNLNNRDDFIKFRAESDSSALKRKFSDDDIYKLNMPKNNSRRQLYDISEKIRYELLGTKMLKGISKNLRENYSLKLSLKRKDILKKKEDVAINEAFELYMLKNFFNVKLNPLSEKILGFWENDFNSSFKDHIEFLIKNIENQQNYNSKFSEILKEMDIFEADDDNTKEEEEQDVDNQNNDKQNNDDQSDGQQEKSEQEQDQN